MALFQIDHYSQAIKQSLLLNVLIPDPGRMEGIPVSRMRVLYLLHGLGGDASDWQRRTSIETIVEKNGLVVVMPSGARSFYSDLPNGQLYFTYLTEELPQYLKDVFGLNPIREENFIAGNSMGGYGAMKAALLRPDLFGAAASFSGVLSLEFLKYFPDDPRLSEFEFILGGLDRLSGSQFDPQTWFQSAMQYAQETGRENLPRLFVSVGRQEDIYPLSMFFVNACQAGGFPVEYYEEDGEHDWLLWDKHIRWFLNKIL